MSLTAHDKKVVKEFWAKTTGHRDELGAEALSRLIVVYPATKVYFSHWPDLGPGSPSVKKHGKVIIAAIDDAVNKIDGLVQALSALSDLHAFKLRIDPSNFKLLSHTLLVACAIHFPHEFNAEVHVSLDKFLAAVGGALSDKYR